MRQPLVDSWNNVFWPWVPGTSDFEKWTIVFGAFAALAVLLTWVTGLWRILLALFGRKQEPGGVMSSVEIPNTNINAATATLNVSVQPSADATNIAAMLMEQARARGALDEKVGQLEGQLAEKDQQIRGLEAAIDDLKAREARSPAPRLQEALAELKAGHTEAAETLFREIGEQKTAEGAAANREAAQAYKHLGALAFLHDTRKALAAYARAADLDPDDADALNQLGALHYRLGEIDEARARWDRVLTLGNLVADKSMVAVATGNLGLIYHLRGDLDRAEEMQLKCLEIDQSLGNEEGLAGSYGNLGLVYWTRGNFDQAEEMHRKNLAMSEKLGDKAGQAAAYGNLGLILRERGDLDGAEDAYQKSLVLDTQLARKDGMASTFGNLAHIYQLRGDLDRAEEMVRKSLRIEQQLGRKDGIATDYCNLGIIFQSRGNFDQAEEMYQRSLVLEEELGRKEGIAYSYANLAAVHLERGNRDLACQHFSKALPLFVEVGMAHEIDQVRQDMRIAGCPDVE